MMNQRLPPLLLGVQSFAKIAHRTQGNTYIDWLLQRILQKIQMDSHKKRGTRRVCGKRHRASRPS
jgi:hypothetical protein